MFRNPLSCASSSYLRLGRDLAATLLLVATVAAAPRFGHASPPASGLAFVERVDHGPIAVDPGWVRDAPLQRRLDDAIRDLGLADIAAGHRLGVALVDLTGNGAPRLAEVRGNEMMYAASVPKIAILYAAFQAEHEGRLRIDGAFHDTLTQMVRVSSNIAASAAIQKIGFGYIASVVLQSGLYNVRNGGGLWVGKAYGGVNDRWHRDPVANTSHGATPLALARLLTLLGQDRLIDADTSREMKEILGDPGIHHKFVRGLDARPGSRIFRKSGTWQQWHGDAALVERDGKRYVAVALCEDANGGNILERLIVALDDCVPEVQVRTAGLAPVSAAAAAGATAR